MTRRLVLIATTCSALLGLSGTAAAATLDVEVGTPAIFPGPGGIDFLVQNVSFTYTAGGGEANALVASRTDSGWRFTDPGATITAPVGECTVSADGHHADCPRPVVANQPRELLFVNAGDRGDTINVTWPASAAPSPLVLGGTMIDGGTGDDTIAGSDVNDDIRGGDGDDRLDGADGSDEVVGGAGRDRLSGGFGDDALTSRDGVAEPVDCGAGTDSVLADPVDVLTACESDGSVTPSPGPGPGAAAADRTAPSVSLGLPGRPHRIRTVLRRGLLVSVRCSEACTIRTRLYRGSARSRSLDTSTRRLGHSGRARVRLRVEGATQRDRLRSLRRTRLTVRVTVTDPAGNRRTRTRRLALRR
jgi:hypothetical protein